MKIKSLIKTLMTFITLAATASLGLGQVGLSAQATMKHLFDLPTQLLNGLFLSADLTEKPAVA